MRKIVTYTLITILISSFSFNKNAYAEKINNYNNEIVKLESNYINSFSDFSIKNTVQKLNSSSNSSDYNEDNFNPILFNLIIPGYTQFYYGDIAKGILFISTTILAYPLASIILPLIGFGLGGWGIIGWSAIIIPVMFISYISSIVDAQNLYKKNKKRNILSLNKTNNFDVALFSKDF